MRRIERSSKIRDFHQAKWDEPIIFELSQKGERGILIPETEEEIKEVVGDGQSVLPDNMRREQPPNLPEISQPRVLRHYMRLSQQTLGADVNIEIGQGTCTVKYSPKINEFLARMPEMTETAPLQHEDTVQGPRNNAQDRFDDGEISGMDGFTFQPGGGSQAIMALASIVRNYHKDMGQRREDEIITTIYSHPSMQRRRRSRVINYLSIRTVKDILILKPLKNSQQKGLQLCSGKSGRHRGI